MLLRRSFQTSSKSVKGLSLTRQNQNQFGVGDVVTVRDALNQALMEEMELDKNVSLSIPKRNYCFLLFTAFFYFVYKFYSFWKQNNFSLFLVD